MSHGIDRKVVPYTQILSCLLNSCLFLLLRRHSTTNGLQLIWTLEPESASESYSTTDSQSASLSWNKGPIWGLGPDFYYCLTVACLLMWGPLSDERTGVSLTIAAGPRQRSHSQVRVAWDSWLYFTVSDSRPPSSSPRTARRATVEVFDPASTRDELSNPLRVPLLQLGANRTETTTSNSSYTSACLFVVMDTCFSESLSSIALFRAYPLPRQRLLILFQPLSSNGLLRISGVMLQYFIEGKVLLRIASVCCFHQRFPAHREVRYNKQPRDS
jgi:hypothetical protein